MTGDGDQDVIQHVDEEEIGRHGVRMEALGSDSDDRQKPVSIESVEILERSALPCADDGSLVRQICLQGRVDVGDR